MIFQKDLYDLLLIFLWIHKQYSSLPSSQKLLVYACDNILYDTLFQIFPYTYGNMVDISCQIVLVMGFEPTM